MATNSAEQHKVLRARLLSLTLPRGFDTFWSHLAGMPSYLDLCALGLERRVRRYGVHCLLSHTMRHVSALPSPKAKVKALKLKTLNPKAP